MDRTDADGRLATLATRCFWVVAGAAPFNVVLFLVCWCTLSYTVGAAFADASGCLVWLPLPVIQVAAFAALYLPTHYLSRQASPVARRRVMLALTALFLGFWFGCAAVVFASMALTGMSF